MPDGEEQQARDRAMSQVAMEIKNDTCANPNQWSDTEFQPWLFGHNVFTYVS
jgi:salicylate hydroxylase